MSLKVHRCEAGHFHLVEEGVTVVWPFFSFKEGEEQVTFFLREKIIKLSEAETFRIEMRKMLRTNLRSQGKFTGRMMPKHFSNNGVDKVFIRESWRLFCSGTSNEALIKTSVAKVQGGYAPIGIQVLPLECDFVDRTSGIAKYTGPKK